MTPGACSTAAHIPEALDFWASASSHLVAGLFYFFLYLLCTRAQFTFDLIL